ncbi:unnamed protein product [Polarella glacialis]|uniref:Uncharacterized protein n=1 Tax=Polarella glacialis TaxID=89957 RepID=A0A813KYY6_POLGL|nr:unnamed protein product [Polarella glacialis]
MSAPTPAQLQAYGKAILRLADLLSLTSLVPVILRGRFNASASLANRAKAEKVRKQQEASTKETSTKEASTKPPSEEQPEQEDVVSSNGLGVLSVLLLIASTVIGSWGVFQPQASGGKHKASGGSVEALLKALAKGRQGMLTEKSTLDAASFMATESLKPQEAFEAAHCLLMLTALVAALLAALTGIITPLLAKCVAGQRQALRPLIMSLALLVPVLAFCIPNQEGLSKVVRSVLGAEGLPEALQLFLRVMALLAADVHGTPPLFAALQVASLAATLSAQVATGGVAKALVPFSAQKFAVSALFDSGAMTLLLPLCVGLIYLAVAHLQKSTLLLTLACMLSVMSSPLALIKGWPVVAAGLEMSVKADGLVRLTSRCYAIIAATLVMSGGTMSMLSGMVTFQAVSRIHGAESLFAAFS